MIKAGIVTGNYGAPMWDRCPMCNGTGDLDQYNHDKHMAELRESIIARALDIKTKLDGD